MTPAPARLLREIRKVGLGAPDHEATDGDWLRRFVVCRDEAAFTALVRRHGPMVFGVGRRVLRDVHAAEDVFQATFVVLARNAKSIRKRESVGSWLHGVAYRLANKSKADAARRQSIERQKCEGEAADPAAEASWREYLAILDEELDRLPERLRVPLVMCYLEGQTRDEAARHVGWSLRTFDRRLGQGRGLLGARLSRRGVTLGAALVTALLGEQTARASVPACLTEAAVKSALAHAAGSTGAALPSSIAVLIEGIEKTTVWTKAALAAACILGISLAGYGLVNAGRSAEPESQQARVEPKADDPKPDAESSGARLPEGAVMRLGTLDRRAVGAKLAMSADGKSIIGVRGGKYIHVWDAATGKPREKRELPVNDAWWSYWLSDDGRWLATADKTALLVWDTQTAKKIHRLTVKDGYIMPAAFSADGKMVAATANAKGQTVHFVHVWNLADGKEIFAKEVRVNAGSGVLAFSPDGKHLLAAFTSVEEGMHCWDLATGKELWQQKEFVPSFMALTPDGKILSPQDKFHVVDLATGNPIPLDKKPPLNWDTRPTLTPDGRTLLLSTPDGVIVWDMVGSKELRTLKGAGEELVVAPDGKSIITNNGSLQRWDLATGRPFFADNLGNGHVGEVTSLVMSADDTRLASASSDGTVRLWDITTGKALHVWRGHEASRPVPLWRWMKAGVAALDMTPDGRWVLSAGTEEKIRLHDAATGKEVHAIALPARENGESELRVFHLRITPDGTKATALFGAEQFMFSIGPGEPPPPKHTYKLATWDLKSGKLAEWRAVEILPPRSSAISPDGRTFLAGGILTDVKTGQETARLEGIFLGGDEHVAFSADGSLVAGMFAEETKKNGTTYHSPAGVRVWEAATGKMVAHLKTKSWVAQVAFHPNNRYVITNDYDGIQMWDATTGKVVAVRQMHEKVQSKMTSGSFAGCLAFTPDGRRLATGHPDSTILLWNMAPPSSPPAPAAAQELDALWRDLGGTDVPKAWRAVWRLVDVPNDAVLVLRGRLKPVEPAPVELTRRLIAELEDGSFEKRRNALKELKDLGPRAEPALREALHANPSAEQKKGITEALTALASPQALRPEALRELRAVIVLERNGSPAARSLLTDLAKGVPAARLTRAANIALVRAAQPNR